jgi:integrase
VTWSCLHAMGRRVAHGLYFRATLQQLPSLTVQQVYLQAVVMADAARMSGRRGDEPHTEGTVTFHQGLTLVVSHLGHQVAQGDFSPQTINKMASHMASLATFMTAGLHRPLLAMVSVADVGQWINSSGGGRKKGKPSVALRHSRRSAARLYFRVLRQLDLFAGDPTLDICLPPRSSGAFRPLTDEELIDARYSSQHRHGDTRLPAAMALGEACVGTGELAAVQISDCDLAQARVWIRGTTRSRPRWGYLSAWGVKRLRDRIEQLSAAGAAADASVVYEGRAGGESAQSSACLALNEILELAGLAGEPGVKPMSIPAAFARRVYDTTKDLGAVADALGRRDLNSAARMIGLEWHKEPDARREQLAGCVLDGSRQGIEAAPGVRREHRRNAAGRAVAPAPSPSAGTAQSPRPRTVPAVNVMRTRSVPR